MKLTLSSIYASCLVCTFSFAVQMDDTDPYTINSDIHLINEVELYRGIKSFGAVIEIPSGASEKWEVEHLSGNIKWEFQKSKPRVVSFLPYPGNYGFLPQTLQGTEMGGDGDPLDVIVLSRSVPIASIINVRIIGLLRLLDKGEIDDKYIALPISSDQFDNVNDISEMFMKFPGVIEIISLWFERYKPGEIQFIGYEDSNKASEYISEAHDAWKLQNEKYIEN